MKNLIKYSILAGFALSTVACATPTQQASADVQATAAKPAVMPATKTKTASAAKDPNKKVCKKTQQTGSRFNKKLCMTQKQWNDIAEKSKARTKKLQEGGARNIRARPNG